MSDDEPTQGLPQTGKIRDYSTASLEHVAREVSGLRNDIGDLVKVMRDQVLPSLSHIGDRVGRFEVRFDVTVTNLQTQIDELRAELAAFIASQPPARRRRARRTATTAKTKSARPKLRR